MPYGDDAVLLLRAGGTAIAIDIGAKTPTVLHWGADPGEGAHTLAGLRATAVPAILKSSPDVSRVLGVWPTEEGGWAGTPAQSGDAGGSATTPRPRLTGATRTLDPAGGGEIELSFEDAVTAVRQSVRYRLDAHGVLAVDMSVVRDASLDPFEGAVPYRLDGLRALLPLPDRATELLDFTGAWCRERAPQRCALGFGTHLRRARRGRPGHDSPFLLAAGTASFGFGHGEVWAVHLAWSGEGEYLAERLPEGAGAFASALGAGEALRPGEVILADGDRYDAPTAVFVWSDAGLDGAADRLHRRLRSRKGHPSAPRPLVLNTWEAVYFDQDLDRLTTLVDRAAQVGVERVVLDDGWFRGRRGDDAGLGDWFVDDGVWPDGLAPLVDLVRSRGMQFGLWFEPEMINIDSDLARAHPEWVVGPRQGLGGTARHQHVLDLAHPGVFDYLLERIGSLVAVYDIDYLKWDHNRDLLEAVGRRDGRDRPIAHEQTVALYALLDALRERHPGLEIETCASGGGRVDLGILDRTDRIWASDCNDPVERVRIERWTRLLVPPELIGSHVGAARSHTTARTTDLSFRLIASLTAHAGIEMDLSEATAEELAAFAAWSALYRELRWLIHSGRVVHADLADDATALEGIIAADGTRALYTWTRFETSAAAESGRIRFPGLDRDTIYRVVVRDELGRASRHARADPEWVRKAESGGIELSGAVLAVAGVPMPALNPQQAMLLDLERIA